MHEFKYVIYFIGDLVCFERHLFELLSRGCIVSKYHLGGHDKDSTPSAPASAAVHRGRQNPKISLTIIAQERPSELLEAVAFAAAAENP